MSTLEPPQDRSGLLTQVQAVVKALVQNSPNSSADVAEVDVEEILEAMRDGWEEVQTMPAVVFEVREAEVDLDVIVEQDPLEVETRTFPRSLLEGAVKLEVGHYVHVVQKQRPGEIRFTFHDAEDDETAREVFEGEEHFSDLSGIDFSQEL